MRKGNESWEAVHEAREEKKSKKRSKDSGAQECAVTIDTKIAEILGDVATPPVR